MLKIQTFGLSHHPYLVFLHGFLGCKEDFLPMIEQLSSAYYCITLDLPGHGSSPFHHDPVQQVYESLQALDLNNPTCIGYSMGGRFALWLQSQYPTLFSRLVLLSAHTGIIDENEKKDQKEKENEWQHLLLSLPPKEFVQKWYEQPLFSSLKLRPDLHSTLLRKRIYQNPYELAQLLEIMSLTKQPYFKLSLPTYFLYGEDDGKYAALYSRLPSSIQVDCIRHCSHAILLEDPKQCADYIQKWLISKEANICK